MKEVEKQNIPILSPRYGISCSHHPDAYRAPRSILISLFFAPHPVRIFRRTQIDAPRRGRRPRRPASAHLRIPMHSRLSLRRGRRPRRPVFCSPIAGCTRVLLFCLRRPYFFQQRKKYGKERRQKPTVFGFPFRPIVTAVQKGSAPNRLHSYPRCRSCVPRGGALLRFCAAVAAAPRPRTKRYPSGRAERVSQFT